MILVGLLIVGWMFHRQSGVRVYRSFSHWWRLSLFMLILATCWDQIAIARGHWSFGEEFLLGIKIGYMPIEEFGFVLVVSYLVLVVNKVLERK